MKRFLTTTIVALALAGAAFAEGTITWCDDFKVKHKGDPVDTVSYAQGPGRVHSGDTYKLNSVTGNRLLFWVEYNPALKLTGENTIHVTWSQVRDDGSELEMQNQDVGGVDPHHQGFAFIPFAVPGKFVMRIILLPTKQVLTQPRTFTIEP